MFYLVSVCFIWCLYVLSGVCMFYLVSVCFIWCVYVYLGSVCFIWCLYVLAGLSLHEERLEDLPYLR